MAEPKRGEPYMWGNMVIDDMTAEQAKDALKHLAKLYRNALNEIRLPHKTIM